MKRSHSQLTNPIINDLHANGYVKITNGINIPSNIFAEIKNQVDKRGRSIFNHHETQSQNDHKRLQCNIWTKTKRMKNFIDGLNAYLTQNINPTLSISKWVILHSKPRCQDQASHCDYIEPEKMSEIADHFIPLAVLVSLMAETQIHVWPKSHLITEEMEPIERQIIIMNEGDIFVFRGDVVHAGSSYEENNYRLHAYMDSELVPRLPNRTWEIKRHASELMRKKIEI
jgi:hypothetical protein